MLEYRSVEPGVRQGERNRELERTLFIEVKDAWREGQRLREGRQKTGENELR